jgi:anti-anti-sigma factor
MRRTGLELEERRKADRVSVLLAGELDIDSAHRLQQTIARLFSAGRVKLLTLDLSALAFIDSTGLAAIVYASKLCDRSGCELAMIRGPTLCSRSSR